MFYIMMFVFSIFSYNEANSYKAVCIESYSKGSNNSIDFEQYSGNMTIPITHNLIHKDKFDYIEFVLTDYLYGLIPQKDTSTRLIFFQEKQKPINDSNKFILCNKKHNFRINYFSNKTINIYCFNVNPINSLIDLKDTSFNYLLNINNNSNSLYCLILDEGSKKKPTNIRVEKLENDFCFLENNNKQDKICFDTIIDNYISNTSKKN